jgi:hypothetical protein
MLLPARFGARRGPAARPHARRKRRPLLAVERNGAALDPGVKLYESAPRRVQRNIQRGKPPYLSMIAGRSLGSVSFVTIKRPTKYATYPNATTAHVIRSGLVAACVIS